MAAGVLRDGRPAPAWRGEAAPSTDDNTAVDDTAVDLVEVLAALRVAPQQAPDEPNEPHASRDRGPGPRCGATRPSPNHLERRVEPALISMWVMAGWSPR